MVQTEWIELPEGVPAYLALEPNGDRQPALLLIHDRVGIAHDKPHVEPQHIFETAQDLAAAGYVSLVVDLFSHGQVDHSLRDDTSMADLGLGLRYLQQRPDVRPDRVGVIGFCLGGRVALMMATHFPDLAACVDFYGRPLNKELSERQPEHPMARLAHVECPILGLFGALDTGIPVEQAYQLDAELARLGKSHKVVVYPEAAHAFYNHLGHAYHQPSAEAARKEMLEFLAANLEGTALAV
ncbi:MAG: dienelactone hydrolase family protein [Chloroflexi bacterium]|nr:dienelactone hydrolase family protein [Chloroflexota bacterium]